MADVGWLRYASQESTKVLGLSSRKVLKLVINKRATAHARTHAHMCRAAPLLVSSNPSAQFFPPQAPVLFERLPWTHKMAQNVPLDQRKSLCGLVETITSSVKDAEIDQRVSYPWEATMVIAPAETQLQKIADQASSANPQIRSSFNAWKKAPEWAGERVVIFTKDAANKSANPFCSCGHFKVPGCNLQEFTQWFRTQNTCEMFASIVATTLQIHVSNGSAPTHTLNDGTLLELKSVDMVEVCAKMAYSGLIWKVHKSKVRGCRALITGKALEEGYNHRILRFTMRSTTNTNKDVYLWCDPTARQVALKLPPNVDVKFWEAGDLPEEYTKYKPPRLIKLNALLDMVPGTNGKCCAPRAFLALWHAVVKNATDEEEDQLMDVWEDLQMLIAPHCIMAASLCWDSAKDQAIRFSNQRGRDAHKELQLDKPRSAVAMKVAAATAIAAVATLTIF